MEVTADNGEVTVSQKMVFDDCVTCGVVFGVTNEFKIGRLNNPKLEFYCPNGHKMFYSSMSREDLENALIKYKKETENLHNTNISLQAKIDQVEAKQAETKLKGSSE